MPQQKQNSSNKGQIQISDNLPGAEYTNLVQINHAREEFQMICMNVLPPSGRVVAKLITTPGHFKRLVAAMLENLKKYEERFGEIKEAAGFEKEIGFKG